MLAQLLDALLLRADEKEVQDREKRHDQRQCLERQDRTCSWTKHLSLGARGAADYSGARPCLQPWTNKGLADDKSAFRTARSRARLAARIAAALERLAPAALPAALPDAGDAFVWEPRMAALMAVAHVAEHADRPAQGDRESARDTLLENTRRFADGLPANNALLWGARGMGKSSLVKAVHAEVNRRRAKRRWCWSKSIARRSPACRCCCACCARDKRRFLLYLRRSFLRQGRHQLQIAEGGAGRRHRRAARQCAVLRHLKPPPSDAARHDGQ